MHTPTPPDTAIILVNLGTPDSPTPNAVKRYLQQFLSDPRVIEIPKLIWAVILNLFVLPKRAKKVAHAYQSIWQQDSPIRLILQQQVKLLQQKLDKHYPNQVSVYPAMTYGNPALLKRLDLLKQQSVENVIILPLYPQYSATTTGAVFDVVAKWGLQQRNLPNLYFIKDYYQHPLYIKALAESIKQFQQQHGKPEKLLFSFHGIPKINTEKGDPYADRCRETAKMVATTLQLADDEWLCSFQSRFGTQEWVKPYTDETLETWGKQGVYSVHVLSPAFSADCLETLEELAVENKQIFINSGGKDYHYIPALNTNPLHLELLQQLVTPFIKKPMPS